MGYLQIIYLGIVFCLHQPPTQSEFDPDTPIPEKILSRTGLLAVAPYPSDENLFAAIKAGDLNRVKEMIKAGNNLLAEDEYGQTPLFVAISYGQTEIAELLISAGVDVNVRSEEGPNQMTSPVYKALELGNEDLAELLILKGADPKEKKEYYYRALITALNRTNIQEAELLISRNKIKIDDSGSMLINYAYGSAATRQLMRTYGPPGLANGSVNLLDQFIKGGITLYNVYNDKLDFPLATTFLHHKDQPFRYSVDKAFDGDAATSWVEGVQGSGIGEKVAFDIDKNIKAVSILPGFGVDKYFLKNNRLKNAKLTFYELGVGAAVTQVNLGLSRKIFEIDLTFKDEMTTQKFELSLPASDQGLIAILEILAVYAGTRWDDTCISEISLIEEP